MLRKDCCSYFIVEFYLPGKRRDVVFVRYTSVYHTGSRRLENIEHGSLIAVVLHVF